MFIIPKDCYTIANSRLVTSATLNKARGFKREVVNDLGLFLAQPIEIEDVNIRSHAYGQNTTIINTNNSSGR